MEKGSVKAEYIVSFRTKEVNVSTIQGHLISSDNITVNNQSSSTYGPETTIDGNLYTRWMSDGRNEWILYDFKQSVSMNKLEIAWFYGDERNYRFKVEFSDDLNNWKTAFEGETSGKTEDLELFDFGGTYAGRYMRITCKGHTSGTVNHICEVQ